jgi:hypothetical protein
VISSIQQTRGWPFGRQQTIPSTEQASGWAMRKRYDRDPEIPVMVV